MKVYTNSTSINELIASSIDKLKTLVDSSTIIGEALTSADGTTIIPISKVTVGFVVGGGEYADLSSRRVANHFPMSGGSSGGMSISPVGFLILRADGEVDFVNVENKSLYQTVLNMFNSLLEKIEKEAEKKSDKTSDKNFGKTSENASNKSANKSSEKTSGKYSFKNGGDKDAKR